MTVSAAKAAKKADAGKLAVRTSPSGPLGRWLSEAAACRTPLRVTLHQLVSMPIEPTVAELFVCENPSVLRAAVAGQLSAPGARVGGRSDGFALSARLASVPHAAKQLVISSSASLQHPLHFQPIRPSIPWLLPWS